MTQEPSCHLCNTYHMEREGCVLPIDKDPFRRSETCMNTPALDAAIEELEFAYGSPISRLVEALKEIRALLGGKRD